MASVGSVIYSHFGLYEADGTTPRTGASADVEVALLRDDEIIDLVVTVEELEAGDYVASFTPDEVGFYTVKLTDTAQAVDIVESFEVSANSLDDVAAAVAAITAHDALVSVTGIETLRASSAWSPNLIFLRRSTMSPIDPDSVTSLEILGGDGSTEVEAIDGEDLERVSLGNYEAAPAQLEAAGTYFLRVTFVYGGTEIVDVLRIYAQPARGEASSSSGSAVDLARVYTYPSSLEAARFDLSDLTQAEVWRRIKDVSAQIEVLTKGNLFNGEYGTFECSGRGRRIVYHPQQHPFVHLESVQLSESRTDHGRDGFFRRPLDSFGSPTIASAKYHLRAGMVEGIRYDFPMGAGNVLVTGAIGKLEPAKYAETLSASEVGADSDSVQVEDSTGFAARDVVDIIGETFAVRVILTSIDRADHVLYYDAVGGEFDAIPAEAVVRTFGAVPRAVEQVANYLFGVLLREEAANADGVEHIPAGRIRRERTDNYEIEFQMAGINETLTGSPKYDLLLLPYMKAIDVRIP
jgi:hypothetical protein